MSDNLIKEKDNNDYNENQQNSNEINNKENKDISPPPLETEEELINKEDIKDIVDYLSNLDYEKYSRDMEIKEALMI